MSTGVAVGLSLLAATVHAWGFRARCPSRSACSTP
jgi:hypothetical protein